MLENGIPSRLWHSVSVIREIRKYCQEENIQHVVFGGDLFHKRGVLYTQAYNLVVNEISKLAYAGIAVYCVPGNHDYADRSGSVNAMQALAVSGMIYTISAGFANWLLTTDKGESLRVTGIAYCDSRKELIERLDSVEALVDPDERRIIVMHHGFQGARVGSSLEYKVKEEVDPKILRKYKADAFYSGHYHVRQSVGRLTYIGSPLEHMRGEGDPEGKGFLVYDTETSEHTLVPLKRPKFVKITEDDLASDSFDLKKAVKGNFVDVVYRELPVPWEELKQTLLALEPEGLKPCPLPKKVVSKKRIEVSGSTPDGELLEKYVDFKGVGRDDKGEVLRAGRWILEESRK